MNPQRSQLNTRSVRGLAAAWWGRIRPRLERHFGPLVDWYRRKNKSGYMFVAINGAGLGHLTRCLAIARKLRERAPDEKIVFVATSIAVPLVHQAGFVCHHIPPFALIGKEVSSRQWNELFRENLVAALRLHSPATLIFDGSIPYDGLLRAMKACRGMNRVWIKRGLYKLSVDREKLRLHTRAFDLTICPGELGDSTDTEEGPSVRRVGPILLVDDGETLDRSAARKALRLHEGAAAYVQLGAGNINEIDELHKLVVAALRKMGVQIVVAQSPIAIRRSVEPLAADRTIVDYPNSVYYEAFDFAVLAGGYNSVTEAVALGLPAIFIPNMATGADDQLKRCHAAKAYGAYEVLEAFDEVTFSRMVDSLVRRRSHSGAVRPGFENGAVEAAQLIVKFDATRTRYGSRRPS
jgi:UDP-N-acetylglucosamine--N-acetylmuramyl-(pentapeptide) pyrophosphoryl-undecaprenol N-acetylglucosamine transferase